MKLELMDFQNNAVDTLIKRLKQAKRDLEDGDPQAVILSSPTGSGKTVTTTAQPGGQSRRKERLWLNMALLQKI